MEKLFAELLQVALGTRTGLSWIPSAHEWKKQYELAEEQTVVGLLLSGLESLPAEQLPPVPLKLQWIGMVQMMEAEYKVHCERASELTRRFRAVGFKSCVLKGVGFSQYYPEPARRQCGDIDLWVDGRRKDVIAWTRKQCGVGKVKWHHVDADFFTDVPVEVHSHPAWLYAPLRNQRLQRFFEQNMNAQMVEDKALGFAHTTARFDAVFSLVHSFHHLLEEGIGLRHIVDYYFVLKRLKEENPIQVRDEDETLRNIKSIGLGKYAGAVMWVLRDCFGMSASELLCEPDEKEGRFLLAEIMAGGNFGHNRQDGKVRNSFRRWIMMVRHYPSEVLWMVPWKCWHKVWRMAHRYKQYGSDLNHL